MPSRNMIAANTAVFALLDEYHASRDGPLANAGKPRWICSDHSGRQFLKDAVLVDHLAFSASLKVARFDFSGRAFFFTSGFDLPEPPALLEEEPLDGGRLTTFLSECRPRPAVGTSQIRDIVEFGDKLSTPDYKGHDPSLVSQLFPTVRLFSTPDLSRDESFRIFLLICLSDRRRIDQWIDDELAVTLSLVTELSPLTVPCETLCRSILDMDPSALFLALYRCLEALYAYTQTRKLTTILGLSKSWIETAQILEETLGWYPRQESSLEALLASAVEKDLRGVVLSLNQVIPEGARVAAYVARRIYELRNSLVHYRPLHRSFSFRTVNWNRLCESLAVIVLYIYHDIGVTPQ